MKNILVSFLLIIYLTVNAQVEKKDSIINGDQLSEKEIYNTKRDGWAILKYNSQDFLINFSNNDYLLWLKVNCKNNLIKPSFLIEFTNNYRDGGRGGIDFTSSKDDRFKKIVFFIDGKTFKNPFENIDKLNFIEFKNTLKEGKVLTIKFYDEEYNPKTDKYELDLNREIDFKLVNGQLLEVLTNCE